jgi:hypothetical protein
MVLRKVYDDQRNVHIYGKAKQEKEAKKAKIDCLAVDEQE